MDPSARDHVGVDEVGLAELIKRIADLDRRYEDALFVSLDSASTAADHMDLVFSVIQDGEADSSWRLSISDPIESRLSLGQHWSVEVARDHPLLIDVIDDGAELYFKGPVANAAGLLGALLHAHRNVVGDWRPIQPYVNKAIWSMDLLAGSMGVFAGGPASLMDAYESVLRRYGAFSSRLEGGPAKVWRGDLQWQALDWSPQLLLLDSRVAGSGHRGLAHSASYVIGRSVTGERLT